MKLKPAKRVPLFIAFGVIGTVCLLSVSRVDYFNRLERMTFDMRAREALKFHPAVATNLGFVFIDEASVVYVRTNRALGLGFGLYWPRQVYGRLIQELALQGTRAVALDVLFPELRMDHPPIRMADGRVIESDDFFALQLQYSSNTIIALTKEVNPPPLFFTNALAAGDISTEKDLDGILRRARAFRTYRQWHSAFRQTESEYGIDLDQARIEPGRIVLTQVQDGNTNEIKVPLDQEGNFDLADFGGDKLPPGVSPKAKPFVDRRVWHMGVVLGAQELKLDLDHAEVDLQHGKITLRGAAGLERVLPVDSAGFFYIDWCLPPNDPRLMKEPIQSLLANNQMRLAGDTNAVANRWQGKLVVVGSAAVLGNDLTDRGATPLREDTLLASKHWNVANSIITGRFVQRAPLEVELALIIFLATFAAFLTWEFRPLIALGLVLVLELSYLLVGAAVYIHARYWIPLILPAFGALMAYFCLVTWRVVFEQTERQRVRSIFSTLVSPKIVTELVNAETLSLDGARREITIMFADVRGFTELTDLSQEKAAEFVRENKLSGAQAEACFDEQARETLGTVNLYLGLVADIIIKQDGTLDKFIGDCVMAFWGAPTPNPNHAKICVHTAIQAQRAIHTLNQQRSAENQSRELENLARVSAGIPPKPMLPTLLLGSGINTGMATVGLMGSKDGAVVRQANYTVFGREVNLASRLESASGRGRIFISEATFKHLLRDDPALAATCVLQPPQNLKGIRAAVSVYEVPWRPADAPAFDPEVSTTPGTESTTLLQRGT